jgi:hypothetical protein
MPKSKTPSVPRLRVREAELIKAHAMLFQHPTFGDGCSCFEDVEAVAFVLAAIRRFRQQFGNRRFSVKGFEEFRPSEWQEGASAQCMAHRG